MRFGAAILGGRKKPRKNAQIRIHPCAPSLTCQSPKQNCSEPKLSLEISGQAPSPQPDLITILTHSPKPYSPFPLLPTPPSPQTPFQKPSTLHPKTPPPPKKKKQPNPACPPPPKKKKGPPTEAPPPGPSRRRCGWAPSPSPRSPRRPCKASGALRGQGLGV